MKKLMISLHLIFAVNIVLSAEQKQFTPDATTVAAQAQQAALAQKNTPLIISFFQKMVEENIISIAHLKQLQVARELINPITAEERALFTVLPWAKQLDLFIQMKLPVDMAQINKWAEKKMAELEQAEETRKQVHEDTREVHSPMRFVPIPSGKYVDEITHEEFKIPEGVEIQETPVTQWQWVQVMGVNPSVFVDGPDSEEIIIDGTKIKMLSDMPVENISWNDVQRFLKKLNTQDNEYAYELPSIQEYQALLHTFEQRDFFAECHHKRLWNLTGKYRQFTRDIVELHDTKAHLVFGGNQHLTSIKDIVLPIVYDKSREQSVGLRIIRYKTSKSYYPQVNHYSKKQLSWNRMDCPTDTAWRWEEFTQTLLLSGYDSLRWMFEHKNEYPRKIQDTLDALVDKIPYIATDPAEPLTNYTSLLLENYLLQDISPLQHLTQLTVLNISINDIQDISALKYLTQLTKLKLEHNRIQDINVLQNLTNLIELNVGYNEIQDISPLRRLTKLTDLNLEDNHDIKDIRPLQYLVNLTDLELNNNAIQDITLLQNLINLRWLGLSNNQIQDISPLQHLSQLRWLWLQKNPFQDLSPLKSLNKLERLCLDKDQIEHLQVQEIATKKIIEEWQ